MIELSPLARPYAKAIFAAALDSGNHEMVARDLALLSAVSNTNEVSSLIEDPELSKEKIAQIRVRKGLEVISASKLILYLLPVILLCHFRFTSESKFLKSMPIRPFFKKKILKFLIF